MTLGLALLKDELSFLKVTFNRGAGFLSNGITSHQAVFIAGLCRLFFKKKNLKAKLSLRFSSIYDHHQ